MIIRRLILKVSFLGMQKRAFLFKIKDQELGNLKLLPPQCVTLTSNQMLPLQLWFPLDSNMILSEQTINNIAV
jgi:hypothetical protein